MKNSLIISLLILSIGVCQGEYNYNNLVEIDGVWYKKFSDEPMNGKIYGYFGEEDKELTKVYIGELVNGKKEGKWTSWYHSTGTKMYEKTYKNGKEDGLWTEWNDNGQKETEINFKDGEKDGLETWWYENGQKKSEATYWVDQWIDEKCWDEDGNECECDDDDW